MEKTADMKPNLSKVKPGIYVSGRMMIADQSLTEFDIRITAPSREPVLNTSEMHTIEHLGRAWFMSQKEYRNILVSFAPKGSRTGFTLVLAGSMESKDIAKAVISMFEYIRDYRGTIPDASAKDCGNLYDHNLDMAKYVAEKYLRGTLYSLTAHNLNYPKGLF